jgi:ketosteroid isomerase-like protein
MSQENVEAFKRGIEAGNRGDVDGVLRETAEDVVFLPARSAVEGGYHGHAGLREFLADNKTNFEVFRADLSDVRDLGDRVLAIGTIHIRGRGGGVETDIPMAGVATYRDGKLTRWEDFRERDRALEAVGLSKHDAHADS